MNRGDAAAAAWIFRGDTSRRRRGRRVDILWRHVAATAVAAWIFRGDTPPRLRGGHSVETGARPQVLWSKLFKTETGSHPYALTLAENEDVVIAGLAVPDDRQPEGRVVRASINNGSKIWDKRRTDRETTDYNVECYGVAPTPSGGFVVTCGDGPMTPPRSFDCHERTWTAYLYELDGDGTFLWATNLTNACVCRRGYGSPRRRGRGLVATTWLGPRRDAAVGASSRRRGRESAPRPRSGTS